VDSFLNKINLSLLQNSDQICRSDDEFDDKKGRNILE